MEWKEILMGLAPSWILRQTGVTKYIRTRLLHVPDAALPDVATAWRARANSLARERGAMTPTDADITRAIEGVYGDIAEGKLADLALVKWDDRTRTRK